MKHNGWVDTIDKTCFQADLSSESSSIASENLSFNALIIYFIMLNMFRKTQYVYSVYCIHQQQGPVSHTHTHRKDHTQQLDLNNTCQVATPKKASKNGCRTISCKQLSDSSCPEIFSARCEQKKQFPEWQRKGCLDKQTCNGVSFEKRGVGVVGNEHWFKAKTS